MELTSAELARIYGRWADRTPADVAALFAGFPGRWWVAGGWALEAFTGVARHHDDTDASVLRADLGPLRAHVADRFDIWSAAGGALRPVLPGDAGESPLDALLPGSGQVWLRRSAADPWEFDVLLSAGTAEEWVYRRDERVRRPWDETLWERDGIWYLQPEVQLLHKAKRVRPKDQQDFEATLPHLSPRRRRWLAHALDLTLPGHPWLAGL